jgi:hypothetical protein
VSRLGAQGFNGSPVDYQPADIQPVNFCVYLPAIAVSGAGAPVGYSSRLKTPASVEPQAARSIARASHADRRRKQQNRAPPSPLWRPVLPFSQRLEAASYTHCLTQRTAPESEFCAESTHNAFFSAGLGCLDMLTIKIQTARRKLTKLLPVVPAEARRRSRAERLVFSAALLAKPLTARRSGGYPGRCVL